MKGIVEIVRNFRRPCKECTIWLYIERIICFYLTNMPLKVFQNVFPSRFNCLILFCRLFKLTHSHNLFFRAQVDENQSMYRSLWVNSASVTFWSKAHISSECCTLTWGARLQQPRHAGVLWGSWRALISGFITFLILTGMWRCSFISTPPPWLPCQLWLLQSHWDVQMCFWNINRAIK